MMWIVDPSTGKWDVHDPNDPETIVKVRTPDGGLTDATFYPPYLAHVREMASREPWFVLDVLANFVEDPSEPLATHVAIAFRLRAGYVDRLEYQITEWLYHPAGSPEHDRGDAGKEIVLAVRRALGLAWRKAGRTPARYLNSGAI
jgi:hypothetical protein